MKTRLSISEQSRVTTLRVCWCFDYLPRTLSGQKKSGWFAQLHADKTCFSSRIVKRIRNETHIKGRSLLAVPPFLLYNGKWTAGNDHFHTCCLRKCWLRLFVSVVAAFTGGVDWNLVLHYRNIWRTGRCITSGMDWSVSPCVICLRSESSLIKTGLLHFRCSDPVFGKNCYRWAAILDWQRI